MADQTFRTTEPGEAFRGSFSTAPADLERHSGASGVLRSTPLAVAIPADAHDVESLLRWASESGTAVIPQAARTGMPGGNVGPGVAVDLLSNFRKIISIDPDARLAKVEPGVTRDALNSAAATSGLYLPPDPSSGDRCTIGGMIANNSAGAHSVLHGATRPWVEAIDVVLVDGSRSELRRGERPAGARLEQIISQIDEVLAPHADRIRERWPRVRKNSSGYALKEYLDSGDAIDLLIGSEGTLGLIVGAEVRLAQRPQHTGLAVLEFGSLEAATAAVQQLLELQPATCEMLDRTFLDLVRSGEEDPGYPLREGIEALLFVEVEEMDEEALEERLARLGQEVATLADRVTLTDEADQRRRFWKVRHAASPIIARRAAGRVSMQFIEDSVVPIERIPEYVRSLRSILDAHELPAVIFGHAGDGNLHVNPLVDVSQPGWQQRIESVLYQVVDVVASLGGTLAGEHGDGRLRAPLLEAIWGTTMVDLFRQVKHQFDPVGILNPGVIIPLKDQVPLKLLKGEFSPPSVQAQRAITD